MGRVLREMIETKRACVELVSMRKRSGKRKGRAQSDKGRPEMGILSECDAANTGSSCNTLWASWEQVDVNGKDRRDELVPEPARAR